MKGSGSRRRTRWASPEVTEPAPKLGPRNAAISVSRCPSATTNPPTTAAPSRGRRLVCARDESEPDDGQQQDHVQRDVPARWCRIAVGAFLVAAYHRQVRFRACKRHNKQLARQLSQRVPLLTRPLSSVWQSQQGNRPWPERSRSLANQGAFATRCRIELPLHPGSPMLAIKRGLRHKTSPAGFRRQDPIWTRA